MTESTENAATEPSQNDPDVQPRVPLWLEDSLTAIVMMALALITFVNVVVRYFTDQSFAWTEEISVFLMIVLALVAGSAAFARNRHIHIEFFLEKCSPGLRLWLQELGAWLGALLFFAMAILSSRLVWDQYQYEDVSPGIGVPEWWYSIWLPVLSTVIGLRLLGTWMRMRKPR